MNHYICTGGCGAVMEESGVCQAKDCSKYNHPFEFCDCADNKHYGKLEHLINANELEKKDE